MPPRAGETVMLAPLPRQVHWFDPSSGARVE
jgi:hypothetical protein